MAHNEPNRFIDLSNFFKNKSSKTIILKFTEIEKILGKKLPTVSKNHNSVETLWNDYSPASGAWRKSGYSIVDVNVSNEEITFEKSDETLTNFNNEKKRKNKEEFFDFISFLKHKLKTLIVILIIMSTFYLLFQIFGKDCKDIPFYFGGVTAKTHVCE